MHVYIFIIKSYLRPITFFSNTRLVNEQIINPLVKTDEKASAVRHFKI